MIKQEDFDTFFELLKDCNPVYYENLVSINSGGDLGFRICYGKYTNSNSFSYRMKEFLTEIVFDYKKRISLKELQNNYINVLVEELQKVLDSFKIVKIREQEFWFQDTARLIPHDPDKKEYKIESIKEEYFHEIVRFSNIRHSLAEQFLTKLNDLINNSSVQSIKLKLKLSVADIALLFWLLDEEKLIHYKHKTELYRFIANNFQTDLVENISEASFKNKFLTPETSAIDKLDPLFVSLRQRLRNILK